MSGVEPPWNKRFFDGEVSSLLEFAWFLAVDESAGWLPKAKKFGVDVAGVCADF